MEKTYLKAGDLIGCRVRTLDGESAALRDLVVDLRTWAVRYLAAETDAWAPGNQVLVATRSLAGVDEPSREIAVDLTFEQLRNSPSLASDSPITRDFEENYYRHYGWEDQWQADIDAETVEEPPGPTAPPAEEPMPAEANPDMPGLGRYEELRTWLGETSDGALVRPLQLLVDDADWTLPYLEVLMDDLPIRERFLVARALVAWADPPAQRLHLAVTGEALRQAPLRPYPAAGEEGCEVRTLEERDLM